MSNGSICFNICTFKTNSAIDSQRSKLQVTMCSCDQMMAFLCHKMNVWARKIANCNWQESLMKSCIVSLHMILLSSASMIVKGFCVRTWTRSGPEICLRMTTSRKASEDVRSVTLMQTLGAHAKFPLTPMNSLRTMTWPAISASLLQVVYIFFLKYKCLWTALTDVTSQTWITLWSGWRQITWRCSDGTRQRLGQRQLQTPSMK